MAINRINTTEAYVKHLKKTPAEVQALYQDFLITVTQFFRDPETFEALTKTVFPELIRHRKEDDPIRVWVPGCSTGEEVYSLAIALLEFLGDKGKNISIQDLRNGHQ